MAETPYFQFEDCLLKHHIRFNGWLPICRRRLARIREGANRGNRKRRLKYFTFCAAGAVDVLLLDIERVVRRSRAGKFDTVFFFDKDAEAVEETYKNIPGANGFTGEFCSVVLGDDRAEDVILAEGDALSAPEREPDTLETQKRQIAASMRCSFIDSFPFDVINLDLEEFLFKPGDEFPGRVANALRRILQWQKRPLKESRSSIDGFSLMFTTQIGPSNLTDQYLEMLQTKLNNNLEADQELIPIFRERTGQTTPTILRNADFPTFFRLAIPKFLADALNEADWYVDPDQGMQSFEIERQSKDGPYTMLHLLADVRRIDPPQDRRAPGDFPTLARDAYRLIVRRIFNDREVAVTDEMINADVLAANLERIKSRREMYRAEREEDA